MNYCRICFLLLVLFVTIAACAFFKPKETLVTYTWASFFNRGCGPITDFIENENQKATLVYHCSNGEEITQSAEFDKIEGGVRVWECQRLPDDQLYNLSNSKCQASLVFLGSDHATINFTCAILNLTVGYDIANRVIHDDSIRTYLTPNKVLITYGDGTQEFSVDGEQLIPLGPFKPFPHRLIISYIQQNATISRSDNM